jgi:hypothetical protein
MLAIMPGSHVHIRDGRPRPALDLARLMPGVTHRR